MAEDEAHYSSSSEASSEPEDEERHLNAQEMDKLVQLQSITGIEDIQVCRALLESRQWDLEAVARDQLDLPARPPVAARPSAPAWDASPHAPRVALAPRARPTPPPLPPVGGGYLSQLVDWSYRLLTWPLSTSWLVLRVTCAGLFRLMGLVMGPPALGGAGGSVGRATSEADVRRFKDSFEADYGSRHPPCFAGSYTQLLNAGKRDLKFVLVYLHGPEHEDTPTFCRQTLASPELCEFVAERDLLFWGVSVETGEGHRVSMALRESTYPFLAVIVLRQNRMMLVGRIEGPASPAQLLPRLERIINDNEAFVVAARADREERALNQTIRQEQDAAFLETLRQDQAKEREKEEALAHQRREAEAAEQEVRDQQERLERLRRLKIELVSEIPEEPPKDHPDVVRMLIKLPHGQRLERRFLKSQSLHGLYYYVFCHPDSPDDFDITTNFPKRVLQCKPEHEVTSFEAAGLGRSEMLFVNDLEA